MFVQHDELTLLSVNGKTTGYLCALHRLLSPHGITYPVNKGGEIIQPDHLAWKQSAAYKAGFDVGGNR